MNSAKVNREALKRENLREKRECCAVVSAFGEGCIVDEIMAGKMQLRHQLQRRSTKLLQLTL